MRRGTFWAVSKEFTAIGISTTEHCMWIDGLELMFVGIGWITLPIIVLLYRRINAQRDRAVKEGALAHYTPQELRELGDRAPDFRYMY